jgi:hypothetical protein
MATSSSLAPKVDIRWWFGDRVVISLHEDASATARRQTKDDWEKFEHDRLHPVVHTLLQEMLGFVPPEPPRTMLDIVDAWTAEYAQTA